MLARNLNALLSLGKDNARRSREEEINRLIDLELLRQDRRSLTVADLGEFLRRSRAVRFDPGSGTLLAGERRKETA